jgi:hypothetical protein
MVRHFARAFSRPCTRASEEEGTDEDRHPKTALQQMMVRSTSWGYTRLPEYLLKRLAALLIVHDCASGRSLLWEKPFHHSASLSNMNVADGHRSSEYF